VSEPKNPPMSLAAPVTPAPPAAAPERLPPAFAAAWGVLALGAGALVWVLSAVWAATPEMNDRFLIPLASAWLAYRLRPTWRATPARPSRAGLLLIAPAAVLFPAGWYLLVHVGPRVALLWWLLAALVLAALGLLIVQSGARRARLLLFPLLFCFMALPPPDRYQKPLQRVLQGGTTAAAATALPWLGVPAARTGYVLNLPSGELGVVEACSGVRSVSALTAIALLVAYLRGFGLLRGTALLGMTFVIVIASNTVRIVTSGLLLEHVGRWAIEGWRHEALGMAVVLVGFALIVAASQLLARRRPAAGGPAEPAPARVPRGGAWAVALLVPAAAVCLWSEQFRQAHRAEVQIDRLADDYPGWTGRDEAIDPLVSEMLKCDQILHRVYTNALGQDVHVFVMFWATPANTAYMHHPDACWPSRGWEAEEAVLRPVAYAPGRAPLPVAVRRFVNHSGGDARQVVFYWTQNGRAVVTEGKEEWDHASEYAWVLALLKGQKPLAQSSRLSVLLGTNMQGPPGPQERMMERLCGDVAADVYRLCPWAEPTE
jgi:EpsI family protein